MKLDASCHCGAVHYTVESAHPYPFNLCYCSICRKTAGGGGYAINLGADRRTLQVSGEQNIAIYQAIIARGTTEERQSPAQRHFCRLCGSALWVWDPRWPDLMHPFASAIDSELPVPPELTHLMLDSRAAWVQPCLHEGDRKYAEYPEESLASWHERLGLAAP